MDPTQIAQMLQLFGGAAGAADGGTGMAALMNGGGAGILSPDMTQQLATNTQAPLMVGNADVMSPEMTAQMAQAPTAGVDNGAVPTAPQLSPIDALSLAKQMQPQRQVGQAPSPIAGRGVDKADPVKAQKLRDRVTLAQLLGAR